MFWWDSVSEWFQIWGRTCECQLTFRPENTFLVVCSADESCSLSLQSSWSEDAAQTSAGESNSKPSDKVSAVWSCVDGGVDHFQHFRFHCFNTTRKEFFNSQWTGHSVHSHSFYQLIVDWCFSGPFQQTDIMTLEDTGSVQSDFPQRAVSSCSCRRWSSSTLLLLEIKGLYDGGHIRSWGLRVILMIQSLRDSLKGFIYWSNNWKSDPFHNSWCEHGLKWTGRMRGGSFLWPETKTFTTWAQRMRRI